MSNCAAQHPCALVARLARKQDRPGARPEHGAAALRELLDRLDQLVPDETFRDRRALAAGQDQRGEAIEMFRREHTPALGTEALEGGQVLLDVPLDPEDADDRS